MPSPLLKSKQPQKKDKIRHFSVLLSSDKTYTAYGSGTTIVFHIADYNTYIPSDKDDLIHPFTNIRDSTGTAYLAPYTKGKAKEYNSMIER
jgi:hypothetical protein